MNPEVNALYSSVTRIASLEPWPLEYRILPRDGWERGDYVVTEVLPYDMVNDMEIVTDRDVPVVEGDLVVGALGTRCTILCASDPYAVRGIIEAWGGHRPDVVAGPTANTEAGVQLVKRLTGIGTLNLMRRETLPALREILMKRLSA